MTSINILIQYNMVGRLVSNTGPNAYQQVYWSVYNTPDFTGSQSGYVGQLQNIKIASTQQISNGAQVVVPTSPAMGDLSGNYPGPLVSGLQGVPIQMGAPSDGDILTFNSDGYWTAEAPTIIGGFTAGGDLSGSSTNQIVIGIQSVAVSNTSPSALQVLTATGSGAAHWATPSSGFTAGGDLSGSSTSQTVVAIQGITISNTAPTTTQVLTATSGSAAHWATPVAGFTAGGDLSGTTTNQTVAKIQGITISGTPVSGNLLTATSTSAAHWASPSTTGIVIDTFANRPTTAASGLYFIDTGGTNQPWLWTGSAWQPQLVQSGGFLGTQPPAASNFSNITSNGATLTDSDGSLLCTIPNSATSENIFLLGTALNSSFQVDIAFATLWDTTATNQVFGITLGDTNPSSNTFIRYSMYQTGAGNVFNFEVRFWNHLGSPGTTIITQSVGGPIAGSQLVMMRAIGNGTTVNFLYTINGTDFFSLTSATLTPTRMGLWAIGVGGARTQFNRIPSLRIQ